MLVPRSRFFASPLCVTARPVGLQTVVTQSAISGTAVAATLLVALALPTHAQTGVSPEAAPVNGEVVTTPSPRATPPTPVAIPAAPDGIPSTATVPTTTPTPGQTPAPGTIVPGTTPGETSEVNLSRLFAAKVAKEGSVFVAVGTPTEPVRFESNAGKVWADEVRVDTEKKTIEAKGKVRLERVQAIQQRELRPSTLRDAKRTVNFTETAYGNNLSYDFNTQQGKLDSAQLYLSNVNLSAQNIIINGQRYTADNVIVYPGGLTEAERKIYGTPPFSLRAKRATIVTNPETNATRASVRGAYLYFRKSKLIPLPSYSFNASNGGNTQPSATITPGISFNSADRVLVTTRFVLPIDKKLPERLSFLADVGLSQRVGLRGGASLTSSSKAGDFALSLRRSDIVTTQLTNRIELDRTPEFSFSSRPFLKFNLPGGRKGGLVFDGSYGSYNERFINSGNSIKDDRLRGRLSFTTRLAPTSGVYLRVFTAYSTYSDSDQNYGNTGYEVGYDGQLLPRVRGQVSYRSTNVTGDTPFRFDRVQIRNEARATFDVTLTPRFLLPFDVRYDVSQKRVRDTTFGLLRSYKSFAYGVVYQTVRRDLRLEVRNAF